MRTAFSKAEIESEIASRFADAFKLHEKPPVAAVMSSGIPEVDSLTGGLPRGAITEIFGLPSSGRTSFLLSTLAYATTHEEVCALVDTNDAFDPVSAAAAGVNLDQLLWIRCAGKMEHAFKAADLLLQGGGFGLVALDISDVPPNEARRIISSWWYRFRRAVEKTPTTFVVIAADSCVRSCASLTLQTVREYEDWQSVGDTVDSSNSRLIFESPQQRLAFRSRLSKTNKSSNMHGYTKPDVSLQLTSHTKLLRNAYFRLAGLRPSCLTGRVARVQTHFRV